MPKIVDHNARRQETIAIARRLIDEGGFRAATMRSLAAEAGYANGALKHYFDSKDQIIEATFDSVLDELDALESATPPEDISALMRLRLTMMAPAPSEGKTDAAGSRVLLALADYALESEHLHRRYQQHLERWREGLVQTMIAARDEGSIRAHVDYGDVADRYLSMAVGTAVMQLMYPGGEKSSVLVNFIDTTLASLSAAPAGTFADGPVEAPIGGITAEPDEEFFAIMSSTIDEDELESRPTHRHDVMFSNSLSGDN